MDKPDAEREDTFNNVVLNKACYAGDTANHELANYGVVHFVEVELVINHFVNRAAVGGVEGAFDFCLRACIEEPGNQQRDGSDSYGHIRNPFGVGEHHELRHAKPTRHKVLFEEALAQDTAQQGGYGKNHNRKRHEEVFVHMAFGNRFAARSAMEGEEEQTEHVEGGKAARENG